MKRTLLVVEDDAVQREIIVQWFTRAGYRVIGVGHPRQALQAASFRQFHVAIIDISLPEMDGIELMRRLKTTQAAAQFVITCAYEYPRRHAEDIGAFACLLKPCKMSHLEMIVDEAFENAVSETSKEEPVMTIQ
jgi:DNA-binding NtrC family response regulator